MSSRFFKSSITLLLALVLSCLCACGDGSDLGEQELAALEDEVERSLADADLKPVADADYYVEGACNPGWDGCPDNQ